MLETLDLRCSFVIVRGIDSCEACKLLIRLGNGLKQKFACDGWNKNFEEYLELGLRYFILIDRNGSIYVVK